MECLEGQVVATDYKLAFVVARFNELITENLLQGATDAFLRHGGKEEHLTIAKVPGAFEIPLVAKKLAGTGRYDAIVCLGAVIRGATPHFDYVNSGMTSGIASVALETGIPIIFGVLTTDSIEQAIERSGTKAGNKGREATASAIEMVSLLRKI